jgi:hypothetical protein
MQELNIVELIEKNPITKLSNTYNNKLLNKIKEKFTGFEQQLFISSFYCYLNYDKNIDFIVDLDDIWKWLGFQQKAAAKKILIRNFNLDLDYKVLNSSECKKGSGGHNKEIIMMNIKTFNLFCLKGDTLMSGMLHEYYIKIERAYINSIDDEYILFQKNIQNECEFVKSLDELVPLLTKQKVQLVTHLIKN